jgi:hypothetical protein
MPLFLSRTTNVYFPANGTVKLINGSQVDPIYGKFNGNAPQDIAVDKVSFLFPYYAVQAF